MPFTFSHPVITLPLKKIFTKLSVTGLFIGSIIPDFGFILGIGSADKPHNLISDLFLFSLPLTIIFSYIFHNYVRDMVITNLPKHFAKDIPAG
jgi:hypothetical protein